MEKSIVHVFFNTAKRRGERDALRSKRNGVWHAISWLEYARRVRLAARGLIKLGLQPGGAVAIIGNNRWEWLVADMATMATGGVPAPIYTTCSPEQVAYITAHSEATVAFAENGQQLKKFQDQRSELPKLKWLVLFDGPAPQDQGDVITFEALLKMGEDVEEGRLDERMEDLSPPKLATLIYTSGTTGPPKGVMLSHKNLIFTAESAAKTLDVTDDEHLLSYLPLSHIAEQMLSIHVPVSIGA
jgi:long-subunit acyl-CoA synthetase (AMP-forming)